MDIEKEVDVTPKEALSTLKRFTQDPFLEENDPDLAKGINLIYQNLLTTSFEIVTPEISSTTQISNTEQAQSEEQIPKEESHRRRRRHSKKE